MIHAQSPKQIALEKGERSSAAPSVSCNAMLEGKVAFEGEHLGPKQLSKPDIRKTMLNQRDIIGSYIVSICGSINV